MHLKRLIHIIIYSSISCMLGCSNELQISTQDPSSQITTPSDYADFASYLLETLDNIDLPLTVELENELVCKIKDTTLKLSKAEIDINQYLRFLLQSRSEYLASRNKLVKNYLLDISEKEAYVGPTNQALAKWVDKYAPKMTKKLNKDIRFLEVQIYEVLHMFIKYSFLICKKDKLDAKTNELIAASKQLSKILDNTKRDMGHPDEACSYYGIIQTFLPNGSQETSGFKELLQLYNQVKKEVQEIIGQENDAEETHRMLLLKKFVKALDETLHQAGKYKSDLVQEILEIQKDMDLEIYKPNLVLEINN